jgi:2,3-bisphosphoglycerate-independent phosphoglycerate mutase
MHYRPFVLIVLDGWGHRVEGEHNAISKARTPYYDSLLAKYPHGLLNASEEHVGLPQGQMGNSEIGHMTIGAGTVLDTDLVKIAKAIRSGEYAINPSFLKLFSHVRKNHSTLHVMGLLSAGGVHSHEEHLYAFLDAAADSGIEHLAVHVFTDGRDTAPQSALHNVIRLEEHLQSLGVGYIASISGRFYAMDRDKNYDRQLQTEAILFGESKPTIVKEGPSEAIKKRYAAGELDEHFKPMLFADVNGKPSFISPHDGVFFYNFRADRARQLATTISERVEDLDLCFVTMTDYDTLITENVAYPKSKIETTLAAEISKAGLKQAHIAETEKFPHATFFLNGGRNAPHQHEVHVMVESRKDVPTHDLAPKMRAEAIADKAIEQLYAGMDFIFINFANADMVGHTANVAAIVDSIEELDMQLGRVVDTTLALNGAAFVTADHGNAELNIDLETGEKHTAHTTNLVPAIITIPGLSMREGGTLADVAPTVLGLMNIPKPAPMTGRSLV